MPMIRAWEGPPASGPPATCGWCGSQTKRGKFVVLPGRVDVWLCSSACARACARAYMANLQRVDEVRRRIGKHVTWSVRCR